MEYVYISADRSEVPGYLKPWLGSTLIKYRAGVICVEHFDPNQVGVIVQQFHVLHYLFMENTTQRLFQQLHQDDDPNWRRASGAVICQLCLSEYRKHPYFDEQLSYGHPIDHRLCNGDVVHL